MFVCESLACVHYRAFKERFGTTPPNSPNRPNVVGFDWAMQDHLNLVSWKA
jgi:hypothetical protein